DIGYVFQGAALFDSYRVWENVVFYHLEHGSLREEELKNIATKYLRMVGLSEEHLDLYPSELSGGMRKRVGIARAIAVEPKLIIYDEPTSGLDPITGRLIDQLILELRDKTGSTAIVVSHDLISAFSISDRILIIREGELIQTGTKEEILNSPIPFVREFIKKGLGDLSASS
ncbi:MAG: ABC transporter ATP-binding protein, partial [Aquificaceae bacterium]